MSNTHKDITVLSAAQKRALLAELLQKKASQSRFPLSFAQQRLWFLDQLEPNTSSYNIPTAVSLAGTLNIAALQQTLNEIVRRHEALRTSFAVVEGQPVQVIAPTLTLALPLVNLQEFPEVERDKEVLRLAKEEAQQPFDLTQCPLLRATLLQLSDTEYVLLFTMHHIISDGWSITLLIQEVATLYTAFSTGKPSPLPELPIQYADFAVWQRQWLQGERLDAQLAYWQQQIGSNPPVLQLPTDRPRPVIQTCQGATQSFCLPNELIAPLKTLSRKAGVTLFMTLLAAFKTLLHRYTSQDDIFVGSPIANRNRSEIEGLIGFFVNTLVLRTYLGDNPSFWDLLLRVRECTLSAYAHQDLPFEYLVEKLQPERDLSRNPLFQVSFGLLNTPTDALQLPGLTINFLKLENPTATFDLSLDIYESESELTGLFEYNTHLFDAATINRMIKHFCTLLEGIVTNPDQCLADLPLLTDTEQSLLVEWSEGRRQKAEGSGAGLALCIHQLFEAQVAQSPDAVAVVFGNQKLTYRELNQRANQLADYLQHLGVQPETLVGICVERSLEMLVGILGILKAGGAYVPLDPAYPQERLAFMLSDARVSVLLTQQSLLQKLPQQAAQVICLDTDWELIAPQNQENPHSDVTPQNLAYVIYTSGSTGKSKGVMITHQSLVNAYLSWEEAYQLRSQVSCHLQMASFSFDVFSGDVVRSLCSGGKLVLCPRELLLAPGELYQFMRQEKVDCAEFVPVVLRNLIQYLEQTNQRLDFLRLLICGSDSWYVGEYKKFRQLCSSDTRLINSFGLTEATIDSSYFETASVELPVEQLVPIGRPFANTQIYILDAHFQPVPMGIFGELYIGGVGLARGYGARPELTAAKFVPHPFSIEPGARLYQTGDLARWLPDGNIDFRGRIDYQEKIRGYRIELGEIEATLSQHPKVKEAVITAREEALGQKCLVAYVVPVKESTSSLASLLRRFLQEKLPDYMVPNVFVLLEALPLTPNGKIDRCALPIPDTARADLASFVAPRTPVEEIMTRLWEQVLSLQQVGIHDNFFELGGHSLLGTQIISRLRAAFQVELPLRYLFESPTVVGLAERIETACRANQKLQIPPLVPISRDRELPLSFGQQRLWFLDQLELENAYNIPEGVRLQGKLDVEALTRSFNEVVKRHEALRTSFIAVDGQPIQAIAPSLTLTLPLIDLSHLHLAQREAEVQRLATKDALQPFDLTCCPLLRVTLLRLQAEEHIVLLTMHHIIFDAWSTGVLLQEVAALYAAFSTQQPSPLPELSIQYADFAVWQRQWLQGEVLQTQLNYWKQQLGNKCPRLAFPTPSRRLTVSTSQGATQSFLLSQELTAAITQMCRQEGVTLFMTLLAAFQTSLYYFTGTEDIRVGSPIANRTQVEIEGLMGFFINTLVLRIDLSGNPSFQELLMRSRQVTLAAYAHQDLPFEKLVEELQPERNLSHNPLYQAWFVLQNAPMPPLELPGLTLNLFEIDTDTVRHDLLLNIWESPEGIEGTFEYKTQLLDKDAITRLIRYFEILLHHVTKQPNMRLNELAEILTEIDQEQQSVKKKEIQISALEKLKKIERKPIRNL